MYKLLLIVTIQRDCRLPIRPATPEQQRQAVVEQIGKGRQAVILRVMDTFIGIFSKMQRQRSIGAKQSEITDRYLVTRRKF